MCTGRAADEDALEQELAAEREQQRLHASRTDKDSLEDIEGYAANLQILLPLFTASGLAYILAANTQSLQDSFTLDPSMQCMLQNALQLHELLQSNT